MRIWLSFWALGLIWGSSFLLIRIGVSAFHPVHLVLIRLGIAALGLSLVVIALRKHIPRDWRALGAISVVGIGNTAIPFTLITWGEKSVESGLTSVLQATAALFGLVVAHFAFKDERITPQKLAGIGLGFAGIIVLASRNWQDGVIETSGLAGQIAIVVASLFYALCTTFGRKIMRDTGIAPIAMSALTMLSGAVTITLVTVLGGLTGLIPATTAPDLDPNILLAVLGLGFFNTFIAYLLFYEIVRTLGAAKATMVTYIVPVVGLILGVIFLNEQLDIYILGGAALIFAGIGIVNLRLAGQPVIPRPATSAGD